MRRLRDLRARFRVTWEQLYGFWAFDPVRGRTSLAGPYAVQIQTVDRCNAACRMCPYSMTENPGPMQRMDDALYERILADLRAAGTVRVFGLMLQNEPLIDRDLAQKVRRAKDVLGPRAEIGIVTNGSALTETRLEELIEAGIGSIEVSIDAHRETTFAAIRAGLSLDRVVENTVHLLRRATGLRTAVRFLNQRENMSERAAFKAFWEAKGAHVRFLPLVNRAGRLEGFDAMKTAAPGLAARAKRGLWQLLLRAAAHGRRPTPCALPFTWLYVLCDGRVILCCHDWGPAETVGDLSKQSLAEVWNGARLNHQRSLLVHDRYTESTICRDCSVATRDLA